MYTIFSSFSTQNFLLSNFLKGKENHLEPKGGPSNVKLHFKSFKLKLTIRILNMPQVVSLNKYLNL